MPDFTSALLVTVVIILTVILIIFSVQIFFIFRDLAKNLKDLNTILINMVRILDKIDDTVNSASLITLAAKAVSALASLIHKDESGKRV